MKNYRGQIFILFGATLFFLASLVAAVIILFTDIEEDDFFFYLSESDKVTVEAGIPTDAARAAGRALHGTRMTVETAGVGRVGNLKEAEVILEDQQNSEIIIEEEYDDGFIIEKVFGDEDTGTVETDRDDAVISNTENPEGEETVELIEIDELTIEDLPSDNSVVLGSNISATSTGFIDWKDAVMADVDEYLNVRSAPDSDSELAGRMERGDVGTILGIDGEWVHIESGDLDGYMKKEYCVLGDGVKEYAEEVCDVIAKTTTNGLRVRRGPSKEDGVIRTVEKGYKFVVAKPDSVERDYDDSEWVAVKSGSGIGFVAKEYVDVSWNIGEGITKAELDAIQREKEEAARRGKASTNTDDLILLAALIQGEGNGQPYEGKVAIANVVLNRVNSGAYPNSIYNVIYQPGQFGPAGSGKVAQIVLHGPSKANKEAAAAALGGLNYIGGLTHFKSVRSGMQGAVIGGHVFY